MIDSLAIGIIWAAQLAQAMPADKINVKNLSPIVPIGGVIMAQLFSSNNEKEWPQKIDVYFDDGSSTTGHVGWIEPNKTASEWTKPSYTIRPIQANDNQENIPINDSITGPVVLAKMPTRTFKTISIGDSIVRPQWVELPEKFPSLNIDNTPTGNALIYETNDALPSLNPLEYWRWTLVASKLNQEIPKATFANQIERLAAEHIDSLWQIGFEKLSKDSRGVAASCRDLLTQTATDGTHEFACWVSNQEELNTLLSIMLQPTLETDERLTRVLHWIEKQQPFLFWIEQIFDDFIHLGFANPTITPIVAAIKWRDADSIPIAIEIPPQSTIRTKYERIPSIDANFLGPSITTSQIQWLAVQVGKHTVSQPIVANNIIAKAPKVILPILLPSWNLGSVRQGKSSNNILDKYTTVELRRILGKWELFVSCYGLYESKSLPSALNSVKQMSGIEGITVLHKQSQSIFCVTPNNETRQLPEDCNTFTSKNERGWKLRIELPEAWINSGNLSFAIARTHGDSMQIETTPLPCLPWKIELESIKINLNNWNQVKKFPAQLPKIN